MFREGTSFFAAYTCGCLQVICESVVGFSVQLHLPTSSLTTFLEGSYMVRLGNHRVKDLVWTPVQYTPHYRAEHSKRQMITYSKLRYSVRAEFKGE
jgi:hypothetical protein